MSVQQSPPPIAGAVPADGLEPRARLELVLGQLDATAQTDRRARAELFRQAALAALDVDEARQGLVNATRAVRTAARTDDAVLEARCRTALARALAFVGRPAPALRELDRASPMLHGVDLGMLESQRSVVLYKTGDHMAALAAANAALRLLPAGSPDAAKVLNNRGVLRLYIGGFTSGLDDFDQALATYRAAEMRFAAAEVRTNAGMMRERLGDVAGALTELAEAEDELRALDVPVDRDTVYRAEVLLGARLYDDVLAIVPGAIASLDAVGMRGDADEGRFYVAEALVQAGSADAVGFAVAARAAFTRSRRWGWAALARLVEMKARLEAGESSGAAHRDARNAALALRRAGLVVQEREAWLVAGRFASRAGRPSDAIDHWTLAGRLGRHATLSERLSMLEARARLACLLGRPTAALRACQQGLGLLEHHVAALGASDLRASASERGVALARIGVDVAWARGDPRTLVHWVERWRAAALWLAPVRPPPDPQLAGIVAELRAATLEVRRAGLDGVAGATDGDASRARVAALERAVQATSRRPTAARGASNLRRAEAADVHALLAGRAMIELVQHAGRLGALVLAGGRTTFHDLGLLAVFAAHGEALRLAVHRTARRGDSRTTELAIRTAGHRVEALRASFDLPLRRRLGDRELIVVPDLDVHHVPWSLILDDGRPTSVAPSASLWCRAATTQPPRRGHVAVVAGPNLRGADAEAVRVAALYPGSRLLRGSEATVAAVGAALNGARIAHLAAHGTIRRDNPLFSAIELTDGPAMVHDLELIARPPSVIALASCDSAVGHLHSSNDVIGLAAALLAAGTRTVIGSVVPLPDMDIVDVMVEFHARLAGGMPPAAALAEAVSVETLPEWVRFVAAGALVCYGVG